MVSIVYRGILRTSYPLPGTESESVLLQICPKASSGDHRSRL